MSDNKKKSIQAKIVRHSHRRRFQDYIRTKGRDKATIGYVYWNMYLRSGKGDVFDLEEGLFLADLGIGKNSLRPARKTLYDDGWLSKESQKINPLTGKWGTTAWTVNIAPAAHSTGDGTDARLTGDHSTGDCLTGDRSVGDTVVLHPLYASNPEASTSPVTEGVTSPDEVSESVSEYAPAAPSPSALSILKHIYPAIQPTLSDQDIIALNEKAQSYGDWDGFFAWHRTHKKADLQYHKLSKFLEGVDYNLNDIANHDKRRCATCKRIKTNGAKPGTHAYMNPELHTGLDGQGESWVKGATKI